MAIILVAPATDFTANKLTTKANALLYDEDVTGSVLAGLTNGVAYRAVALSDPSTSFTPTIPSTPTQALGENGFAFLATRNVALNRTAVAGNYIGATWVGQSVAPNATPGGWTDIIHLSGGTRYTTRYKIAAGGETTVPIGNASAANTEFVGWSVLGATTIIAGTAQSITDSSAPYNAFEALPVTVAANGLYLAFALTLSNLTMASVSPSASILNAARAAVASQNSLSAGSTPSVIFTASGNAQTWFLVQLGFNP